MGKGSKRLKKRVGRRGAYTGDQLLYPGQQSGSLKRYRKTLTKHGRRKTKG